MSSKKAPADSRKSLWAFLKSRPAADFPNVTPLAPVICRIHLPNAAIYDYKVATAPLGGFTGKGRGVAARPPGDRMASTVALISTELNPIPPIRGGASELYIDQVAAHLSRWQPVVICPGDPELPHRETRGQVEYFRVPLSGWRSWLYKRYRHFFPLYEQGIARVLQEVQPQVIQVHNRPLLALALRQRHCPQFPTLLRMGNLATILGKRERPPAGTLLPLDAFIACSRFVLEKEKDRLGLGAGSYWVIYNGVDPGHFSPRWEQEAEAGRWRALYGLTDEPTVLFVGKVRESKGVGVLLQAMDRVWDRLPRAALVLAGGTEFGRGRTDRETPFLKKLRRSLAQARGRVILTGFIPPDQVHRAFLVGDIFVGPSQNEEGLGMVFLEASASGLPIIATRMGGIPEIVQEDLNGLLLERKDDTAELGEKIIRLLEDAPRREKLGRQGREWVCRHFSWERIARLQEEAFDAILQAAAVRPGGTGPP